MSHTATYDQYRHAVTILDVRRKVYNETLDKAKKHAALAQRYANQARQYLETIERKEKELRNLETWLSDGQ